LASLLLLFCVQIPVVRGAVQAAVFVAGQPEYPQASGQVFFHAPQGIISRSSDSRKIDHAHRRGACFADETEKSDGDSVA
jgi:hypothetical protein